MDCIVSTVKYKGGSDRFRRQQNENRFKTLHFSLRIPKYRNRSISCTCVIRQSHDVAVKHVVTISNAPKWPLVGKNRSYTIKFKLEVVKYALSNSKEKASRTFGVDRKLVQTWCQQDSELVTFSSSRKHLPGGGMKAKFGDIDEDLYQWLLEQ